MSSGLRLLSDQGRAGDDTGRFPVALAFREPFCHSATMKKLAMTFPKSILLLSACAAFILPPSGSFAGGKARAGKVNNGSKAAKAAERVAKAKERQKEKEARKEETKENKTDAEAKKAENDSSRTEKSNDITEARQARHERRIEKGIKKGYLTPDEIEKLNVQQKNIESMQQQFKGDGNISRDESKQLRNTLNDASLDIWTEKHDADGKQMPVYRLGKDVRLNADVAAKLANDNLSQADARKFLGDFHSLGEMKKKLNGSLSDKESAQLQDHYNSLLTLYFSKVK